MTFFWVGMNNSDPVFIRVETPGGFRQEGFVYEWELEEAAITGRLQVHHAPGLGNVTPGFETFWNAEPVVAWDRRKMIWRED